jgi:hypothetical protein
VPAPNSRSAVCLITWPRFGHEVSISTHDTEPVAALLRQDLRDRSNMTTAGPPRPRHGGFPGSSPAEHRSYRRLVRVLHQLGIPARASQLAAWRELVREEPPAVLADTLGISAGTGKRRAVLGGAGWSACTHRHAPTSKELPGDGQPVHRT